MINKKIGVLLLLMVLFSMGAKAQLTTSVKLNEVLVVNEDNFVDDYGKRHPWFELFNNSAGTVDLRGCFLTNDKNNPKKYMIPKGDVLTKVPPRQHILFWADNAPTKGTFHVNFTFDPSKDNYLALYDSDGTTLIDEITIPAGQRADISYGLDIDGTGKWAILDKVTPSTNNVTLDSNEKIENFQKNDSLGIGMTITAMAVVFIGLMILFLVFKQIGNAAIRASKRNAQKAAGEGVTVSANAGQESGEIFAAIATALYEMSDDNHDIEHTVLTIRKVQRSYSPWSSKLYSLRQTPTKK
ncbi:MULTISPECIES: OadG family transporter subunit [Parabacteroides]|uniref:Lamin tail domain-containing protein n=1 Tax=Parabacteroides distasonis TaxID=823 RepID=A0A3L7ZQE6_PARDI|nr:MULTISPECIES: OadG family transporter subunit [Parabacteroides]NBH88413.1 lamin tail domain-containing protein [Parabacteroides distasonis]RLT73501.1 lamin tail domain-containing protein [Parabacteroides distasonis]TGY58884.1 lamin tail domain-containing protein [Parabacteroides distasonis]